MLDESKTLVEQSEEWRSLVRRHLLESAEVTQRTAQETLDSIVEAAGIIADCFRQGNKLLICGNGGSAADAQHIAAEFVNRLSGDFDRPGLPAISLTTDTSFLTAYANDCGFEGVFERQVATLGKRGDVLLAISTSGNSGNVIKAISAAADHGLITIGLLGEGGRMTELVEHAVIVRSRDTQHVQESMLTIEHGICMVVEQALFGRK
jgi:D-sedoheptulose 7-phosphate isomerase